MNTIKKIRNIFFILLGLGLLHSCVKDDEYAIPSTDIVCSDVWESNMTLHELVALVDADTDGIVSFSEEAIIEGYVISDDLPGNFFKTVSIQDDPVNPTIGIQVEIDQTNIGNFFPLGSKIKINLKDIYAGFDRGVYKVGETYVQGTETRVGRMRASIMQDHVKRSCGDLVEIQPVVFETIAAAKASGKLNTLITINNVQFVDGVLGQPFAPAGTTVNRGLVDNVGGTIDLRNSGYADFADQILPEGSGSITVVLSKYNSDFQLFIRDENDVNFDQPRFGGGGGTGAIFEDGFSSLTNWTTHSITGAQVWETRNFGNPVPCAYMSGFASGNQANEDWLVSKAIAIPSGLSNVTFSFETDRGYNGNPLEVFYTTNFTGDVTTTTWTLLPAVLDTQNAWNTWTNSGNLDVSSAIGGNLYVAFKYTSTSSAAATWELDNVKVIGN